MRLQGAPPRVKGVSLGLGIRRRAPLEESPVIEHLRDVGDSVRPLRGAEQEVIILRPVISGIKKSRLKEKCAPDAGDVADVIDRAQEVRVEIRLHVRLHVLVADPDLVLIRVDEIRAAALRDRLRKLKERVLSEEVVVVGEDDVFALRFLDRRICVFGDAECLLMRDHADPRVRGGKRRECFADRGIRAAPVRKNQFEMPVALREHGCRELGKIRLRRPIAGHDDAEKRRVLHLLRDPALLFQLAVRGQMFADPVRVDDRLHRWIKEAVINLRIERARAPVPEHVAALLRELFYPRRAVCDEPRRESPRDPCALRLESHVDAGLRNRAELDVKAVVRRDRVLFKELDRVEAAVALDLGLKLLSLVIKDSDPHVLLRDGPSLDADIAVLFVDGKVVEIDPDTLPLLRELPAPDREGQMPPVAVLRVDAQLAVFRDFPRKCHLAARLAAAVALVGILRHLSDLAGHLLPVKERRNFRIRHDVALQDVLRRIRQEKAVILYEKARVARRLRPREEASSHDASHHSSSLRSVKSGRFSVRLGL